MGLKFLLIVFAIFFVIALLIHANKPKEKNGEHYVPKNPPPVVKPKKQRVQSYEKWEKKVQKKKAKIAMDMANYTYLSIDDANELFVHNSSADEMKLLDIILDAKLDGRESIKIDRALYERLKSVKIEHCKSL